MRVFRTVVIMLAVVILAGCDSSFSGSTPYKEETHSDITQVCTLGGSCIDVELATTDAERQQGLMYREKLEANAGMLFVFEEQAPHAFWMKNTLIPLDMIRLDEDIVVVDIQTAQPCEIEQCPTYVPAGAASYVLEVNAGVAHDEKIEIGDRLYLK